MTDFISTLNVKSMYDFLNDELKRDNWTIQLHDKRGAIGGTLYGYRFSSDGMSAEDFWKMTEDYTVNGIEREVKRGGETVSIIHAYKEV